MSVPHEAVHIPVKLEPVEEPGIVGHHPGHPVRLDPVAQQVQHLYSTVQYSTVQYSTAQHSTVQYSAGARTPWETW